MPFVGFPHLRRSRGTGVEGVSPVFRGLLADVPEQLVDDRFDGVSGWGRGCDLAFFAHGGCIGSPGGGVEQNACEAPLEGGC